MRRTPAQPFLTTQRIEAFSDGVFAIAITLLVLEIKVPHLDGADGESLSAALLRLWPSYFGYVFSFVMIGIYWANHHYIFHLYKQSRVYHRRHAPAGRHYILHVRPVPASPRLVPGVALRQPAAADRPAARPGFLRVPHAPVCDQQCLLPGCPAALNLERQRRAGAVYRLHAAVPAPAKTAGVPGVRGWGVGRGYASPHTPSRAKLIPRQQKDQKTRTKDLEKW